MYVVDSKFIVMQSKFLLLLKILFYFQILIKQRNTVLCMNFLYAECKVIKTDVSSKIPHKQGKSDKIHLIIKSDVRNTNRQT